MALALGGRSGAPQCSRACAIEPVQPLPRGRGASAPSSHGAALVCGVPCSGRSCFCPVSTSRR
eukprot:GSA120T00015741001.1